MSSSSTPSPSQTSSSAKKGLRWWPAALILAAAAAFLITLWTVDAGQLQDRVVPTLMVIFLTAALLVLWLFLFSRLPWVTRGKLFAGLLVISILAVSLFEVRGFSGDLIPDVRFRWSGQELQTEARGTAGSVTRSPTDFPQFLGPERNAVIDGVQLASDWQAQPPKELWRQPVGDAWSSLVVVGDAVLTQEQRDGGEALVRYDLASGDLEWVATYPSHFESVLGGNGPRATPTVDGDRVFTLGSSGVLTAWNLADGSQLWQRDLPLEHEATRPEWGYAASPLVVDGLVISAPGGPNGHSVTAHDVSSGDLVWRAGDLPASYASPVLLDILGVPNIVVRHLGGVTGHDPTDGRILWSAEWQGQQPNVAQPLPIGNDRLLISSGYGIGSALLQFQKSEAGDLTQEVAWESLRMKAKFTNMVTHRGAVFGLDDGVLVSLDPTTGERFWKRGRYGHGQLLLVDEYLLILSEKGDVVLVKADPQAHEEVARFKALGDKSWNPPTLSGRHLLVRNADEAACFELPLAG